MTEVGCKATTVVFVESNKPNIENIAHLDRIERVSSMDPPHNQMNFIFYLLIVKNIKTCGPVMNEISKYYDILLLQETLLFNCEKRLLGEIHDRYTGVGKAVDDKHPLPPIEMPRGYSGVAILWKKDINHIVKHLKGGGSRIQAVLTDSSKPTLLIGVFTYKGIVR